MKKILFLFLFFITGTSSLFAQGFNSSNGRNHPELNWQVAETEHFLIIYPERISGIENKAAAIAEETYSALSENLKVAFDRKIRIYLSDEDEINNGFAVPFKNAYTNIWVNTNDYSETWTGPEKWLRKVIAHELAHIFHYRAIWTNMGLWQFAVGDPLPRFWTEGLAQYQTETWDSQRGDRWLRKAIFDSRPGYNDHSLNNGRLMYASGNSQLRYFTKKYGDSTLVDLFSHRNSFLGLWKNHDFGKAFRKVTDDGYDVFYEEWRKHMNIYYNTLASQMERVDSLDAKEFSVPGQIYLDAALSPDGSKIALLSVLSADRPVRRLYIIQNDSTRKAEAVAEGRINPDLSWAPDGKTLYYSRLVRGEHSSLINDIHAMNTETGHENRVTQSRKARYPAGGPGENHLSYIVNEEGAGNLFIRNIETGSEERVTDNKGDVQLLWLQWLPARQSWLFHRFDDEGYRNLVLLSFEDGSETILDAGDTDNRKPVISPDGNQIAYTSLRDDIPNVFIYDLDAQTESRFTNLFTGGEVYGWMSKTDSLAEQQLLIKSGERKHREQLFWVVRDRDVYQPDIYIPEPYRSWRQKQAPEWISTRIQPNETLIARRYLYRSFRNLTHAASLVLPYYANPGDWGLFATTNWSEPLGKHALSGLGWISAADPAGKSYGMISYLNNEFYPSILFSFYRLPESARFYGDRLLFEEMTGGDINVRFPLDYLEAPYQSGFTEFRLRHVQVNPYDRNYFDDIPGIPTPQKARQTDLRLALQVKKQRPWRNQAIHPLDGYGLRLSLTGADKLFASETRFLTADLNAFTIFPAIGLQRFYAHARFQAQWGEVLPQNFIGFSRYDNISMNLPAEVPVHFFEEAERVRGYRSFVAGDLVAFGSLEYRIPLLPSLQTRVLGMVSFGSATLSLFTDAGVVWNARRADGTTDTETRWGAGAEIKNSVYFFGVTFSHALGIAQPARDLFGDEDVDLYYRIRAVVPF